MKNSMTMDGLPCISKDCHSRLDRESRTNKYLLDSHFPPSRSPLRRAKEGRGNDTERYAFCRLTALIFAALLFLGAAVRIYGAWQLRHNLNPDSGIVALMAKHMAAGTDFPAFFYGQAYMGSLEPLISALFCAIFGTSGFMVTLGTAFVGWLILFAVFVWARDAHSPAAGLAAMAYCLIGPSGFAHYQISPRGGYAVTILLSTLILWLSSKLIVKSISRHKNFKAVQQVGRGVSLADPSGRLGQAAEPSDIRAAQPEASPYRSETDKVALKLSAAHTSWPNSNYVQWFLLGLLAGLGWWSNQLITGAILTATLMALVFLRWKIFSFNTLSAAIGFFLGSLPFWWWNIFHGWQSFEFAGSLGQTPFLTGLRIFFLSRIPDLIDLNHGALAWRISGAAVYIGAAIFFFLIMLRMIRSRQDSRWIYLFTPFVFILVSALLFSTSHFALMNTSRHLLPLVPVMAVIFGIMTAELAKTQASPTSRRRGKTFFLGIIPLAVVIANQAGNLDWLAERGRGEAEYQRQIEECGRFLESQGISAGYAPYGKHSWNFALNEKICFCDLPLDRYRPYARRAELADRIAVFDNLGDINNFVANYGGSGQTAYSGSTPVCYGFAPPREGLEAVAPEAIESIRDSLEGDPLAELTDGNIDTGWESAVARGNDDWLEINFKASQTVRMIRLLFYEYPETWQIAGQREDGAWKTLTPCVQTAGYIWSGPRPYWSYGMEGYRLDCRLPPEKLKRLQIHRIERGCRLLEIQLFGPAAAVKSEESVLNKLLDVVRENNIKRLYCDRWPANAVFRETQAAVQTSLAPEIFGDVSLTKSNDIWFTPRTGLLVREEDAGLCRQTLAGRRVEMRSTKIGPWVLFDFEPGKWKTEYGRDCGLHWAGFACLMGNNKRWAAELVGRADISAVKRGTGDAIELLRKAGEAWPLYPPAVERLVKLTAEKFEVVGPHSLCGRKSGWTGLSSPTIGNNYHLGRSNLTDAEYWEREYKKIQPAIRTDIKFDNGIELAGLSLSTNILSAGAALTIQYFWKYPEGGVKGQPWVFVHFLHGAHILQDDHPLEEFKGSEYQPYPELFVETRNLVVPKPAPEGEYQIRIGLYDASRKDQKRFNVQTLLPHKLNAVELPANLTVVEKESPRR